jgi:hypothetical protein
VTAHLADAFDDVRGNGDLVHGKILSLNEGRLGQDRWLRSAHAGHRYFHFHRRPLTINSDSQL